MAETNPERAAESPPNESESGATWTERAPGDGGRGATDPVATERSAIALLEAGTQDVYSPARAKDRGTTATAARLRTLDDWLRLGVAYVAETRFARRYCREWLVSYEKMRAAQPDLTGKALYAAVVSERLGGSTAEVETILRRAEQSFCEWPTEHPLRFKDVVSYLVVTEYLRDHQASPGTQTNMLNVVARAIEETY